MMTKAQKEELETLQRITEKQGNEISDLKYKLGEQRELIRHYEVAMSAVKWLWEQANQQPPFQL